MSMQISDQTMELAHEKTVSITHTSRIHTPMHVHTSYELTLIEQGKGQVYCNQSIAQIQGGEILLLGPTPHLFKSEPGNELSGTIVRFREETVPQLLLKLPESIMLAQIMRHANQGLRFSDPHLSESLYPILESLEQAEGFSIIHHLYAVLDTLCHYTYHTISIFPPQQNRQEKGISSDPVERVNQLMRIQFARPITLAHLAETAGLNACAFCRFYKKKTGLTPFEYLIKVRIHHACRLLMFSNKMVAEIAYKSGYKELSSFNKQFRKETGMTPTAFRKTIKRKNS